MAGGSAHPPQNGAYELAIALCRQKDYAAACEAYQTWLKERPDDARALAGLAVAQHAAGGSSAAQEAALALARRAVQLAPGDARLRHTLARLYERAAPPHWADAADAYERACEKDPSSVQFLLDWARALKEVGRPARAAEAYARAVALAPEHPRAHFKLAMALRQAGRREQAADHFRRHLEISPSHAAARFWLAATGGGGAAAPPACPPGMVAGLFDEYADKFDDHLVGTLQYRTPQLLRDLLLESAGELTAGGGAGSTDSSAASGACGSTGGGSGGAACGPRWRACADLGCGTGLMGPLLRSDCGRLVGVDLSAGMCAKARERGCYDAVDVCELVEWLTARAAGRDGGRHDGDAVEGATGTACAGRQQQGGPGSGGWFDLLVAADVLVYIGDLQPLLAVAGSACSGSGALFALSTELLPDLPGVEQPSSPGSCSTIAGGTTGGVGSNSNGTSVGAPAAAAAAASAIAGYTLQPTGRYAHSAAYLRSVAAATGWDVAALQSATIRVNQGKPIHGNLCVLRRL